MKREARRGKIYTNTEADLPINFPGLKTRHGLEVLSSLAKSVIKDVIFALKAFTVASAGLSESLRPT